MSIKGKKFIVTGSEGFIGKALVAYLKSKAAQVICIDRKTDTECSAIPDILKKESDIECVFHLAAQTSVFNNNVEQIRKDNIDTFILVCDACREHNVRLVYASSSTAADGNTTSMYGISKQFNEAYAKLYNPNAIGVRLHNVYGPEPRKGTLLWYLINHPIVQLYNMGLNERHFTYIDDAVQGLMFAYSLSPSELTYKVINVANRERMITTEFAAKVSQRNGVAVRFEKSKRDRDNSEQALQKDIYCVSLPYKTVEEGLDLIFGE